MPYHGFGYIRLFSDPIALATWSKKRIIVYLATFNRIVNKKTGIIQMEPNIFNAG